jgi:hypothetical protein
MNVDHFIEILSFCKVVLVIIFDFPQGYKESKKRTT